MINLTELTDKELAQLQKELTAEKTKRGKKLKGNANIYKRLYESGMELQIQLEGLDNRTDDEKKRDKPNYEPMRVLGEVQDAILKICDITLGNYEIKSKRNTWKDTEGKEHSRIEKRLHRFPSGLYDECYNDYMSMTDEILTIIEKYYSKSIPYRNVEEKRYDRL